jgi:hypothetical protein
MYDSTIMPKELPQPDPSLVAQGSEWAQKIIIEANSSRYREHVYSGYNGLVDIFLVHRDNILQLAQQNGGVDHIMEYHDNALICKNGLVIPASEILSVTVSDDLIDLPPGTPHGVQMRQKLTAWFGGDSVISEPWDSKELDRGVMWRSGGIPLVFTSGYSPATVGITETISTDVDAGGITESTEFSEHFRIDAGGLKEQRQRTNPMLDINKLVGPAERNDGLGLSFLTTPLIKEGSRIYRGWVQHFAEHLYGTGIDIRSDAVSANALMRFNRLVAFAHEQVVEQGIVRRPIQQSHQITG